MSGSEAFLTYLKNNQVNHSAIHRSSTDVPSSSAVRELLEKLKTSAADNDYSNHQTSARITDQIPAPSVASTLTNLNDFGVSSGAASAPSALGVSGAAAPINHRYGYYPNSGLGSQYFGTISPHTFNAALTAIAFAAFLTFGLRLAVNALAGGRRRKRSTGADGLSGVMDVEIEELTNTVLPAVQKSWANMPPFAPEVTYLGFEMLWNYWKERGLKWSTSEEDERRLCLSYRKLEGTSKENYERARSSWEMLSRIGISWTDPFLHAVERGLKGLSCSEPHVDMKMWG